MSQYMCLCIWVITLVTLTVVDSEIIASIHKDRSPRRCITCTSSFNCGQMKTSLCPADRPYCGTVTSSPNFTSTLVCMAEPLCSLNFAQQNQTYKFTCACSGDLCSRPFSEELRRALLDYTSLHPATQNNTTDLTDAFFTSSEYANVTKTALYNSLTTRCEINSTGCIPDTKLAAVTVAKTLTSEENEEKSLETRHGSEIAPRADALKQEVTVPSDDDEDESEGSGSYDESKSQRRPASVPAAPSSYLPANENKGAHLLSHVFTVLPLMLYLMA